MTYYTLIRIGSAVQHTLKAWPEPFSAVWRGHKSHEVRRFDRDYNVGDLLVLREFDPATSQYSGREIHAEVTHITLPGNFGLPSDVGVMSIEKVRQFTRPSPNGRAAP